MEKIELTPKLVENEPNLSSYTKRKIMDKHFFVEDDIIAQNDIKKLKQEIYERNKLSSSAKN